MPMSHRIVSLLVPIYNEAEAIPSFFSTINKVLADLDAEWEMICVNDGSTDNTLALLEQQAAINPHIKVVSFSRNFGKEPAMTAALDFATGDAVIPLDADLQDPPEVIADMVAQWRQGFDVVCAKRVSRNSDSVVKRKTASWFYSLFNKISDFPIPENVGDFRLMDRRVVDVIKQLPEKERFMKGLYSWPGFKTTMVEYDRQHRVSGETKFSYWQLWNFALSGITSFTTIPIRVGTYVGIFISLLSFIYGIFVITKTLVLGIDVPGYASLLVVVLFLGGIQLIFLGMLGEYIGRIYKEVKNRPLYVVEKRLGFDDD
jgi:glycosyltransferase involved in cell wall biosynthesis